MEQIVKDIINIGLGAAEKVKEIAAGSWSFNFTFDELKEKGAANESDIAVKIRDTVNEALTRLQDVRQKVETVVSEGQQKFSETLASLNLPGVNIEDLKSNFDRYAGIMQKNLAELFEKIKPYLENTKLDELKKKVDEIFERVRSNSPSAKKEKYSGAAATQKKEMK